MADMPDTTPEHAPPAGRTGSWPPSCLPRPPAGFVPRPRLLARLDEGLARGLTLVCAPAGFGKTALLADWAGAAQRLGGVAVAGRRRQRPGPVLAARRRRAGPGAARGRRAGRPPARAAGTAVLRGAGDGADQRAGRPTR